MANGSTYVDSAGNAFASIGSDGADPRASAASAGGGVFVLLLLIMICCVLFVSSSSTARTAKTDQEKTTKENAALVVTQRHEQKEKEAKEEEEEKEEEKEQPQIKRRKEEEEEEKEEEKTDEKEEQQTEEKEEEEDAETPPAVTTAAADPQTHKRPNLITCQQTLEKLVQAVARMTERTFTRLPFDKCTLDEQIALLGLRCDRERDSTPEEREQFVDTLTELVRAKLWTHITYLVTVGSTDKALLRRVGQVLSKHAYEDSEGFATRDRSALQIDLLFATLMLCDPTTKLVDPLSVFIGRKRFVRSDSNGVDEYFHLVVRLLLSDYLQQVRLESQNVYDNTRAEFGSRNYLRYWQLQLLRNLHYENHQQLFSEDRVMHTIAAATRDQCLASFDHPIALNYEVMALQVLLRLVSDYPYMFHNVTRTVDTFARLFLIRVQQTFSDVRAFLPTFLLNRSSLPVAADRLRELDAKEKSPSSKEMIEYPNKLVFNQMNKQASLTHRSFGHVVLLNRSNAPLPVFLQPLATMCGRVYLGTGHNALIPHFDNLFTYVLQPVGEPEHSEKNNVRRCYLFPFTAERVPYEAYDPVTRTAPRLRLEGLTAVDTAFPFVITNLQLRTQHQPLANTLRNYRGWLVYLIGEFLAGAKTTALPYETYRRSPDTSRAHTAVKFFELASSMYAYALNRVKRDLSTIATAERVRRRIYRHDVAVAKKQAVADVAVPVSANENWWYSGTRSWHDEPVDLSSTEQVPDRAVSTTEELLWRDIKSCVSVGIEERIAAMFPESLDGVLCSRFRTMLVLGFAAMRAHRLSGTTVDLDDSAYKHLREYVGPSTGLPSLAVLRNESRTVPMLAVLFERRFKGGGGGDENGNENAERIRVTISGDQEDLTLNGWLASHVLKATHRISPLDLLNGNNTDQLERESGVGLDEVSLSWRTIDRAEFDMDQPLTLHIWYPSIANNAANNCDDLSTMRNLVTIRLPQTSATTDFKLYNLMFDDTQYLVIAQTGLISSNRSIVSGCSKLWYSVCTNENSVPPGRRHNLVLDRDQKFHVEIAQTDKITFRRAVRSPALGLQVDEDDRLDDDHRLQVLFDYDEKVLQRLRYPGAVQYDSPHSLYIAYDD